MEGSLVLGDVRSWKSGEKFDLGILYGSLVYSGGKGSLLIVWKESCYYQCGSFVFQW